ncbi:MAG: hypothetical protein K8T90_11650 [Planctomycetes bacterium]|nr:hypothetical protein [Planctomycetota bacterium]
MGSEATSLDELPPESRFAIRALAAGMGPDAIDAVLHTGGDSGRNALRTVVRWFVGPPPARSGGDGALLPLLAKPLEMARTTPPGRRSGTACPSADILRELALGRLDGPLMLAAAEHAADCSTCMLAVVRAAAEPAAAPPQAPRARGFDAPLVLGILAGTALAVAYLLFS